MILFYWVSKSIKLLDTVAAKSSSQAMVQFLMGSIGQILYSLKKRIWASEFGFN